MAKSVCIIGAGPSGLVAAKTLLHDAAPGSFKVTIFDAQRRIGGLWPAHGGDVAGLVHPAMRVNQSRHTVQFSDLAWGDSDPEFPRAWQVGRYLRRYLDVYGGAEVRLGCRVVRTEMLDCGAWAVRTDSELGVEMGVFDYLIVAAGFFGSPVWLGGIPDPGDVPVIHSSQYRDVESLVCKGASGGKIVVVGGQMSGVEVAGTIAADLSSLVHSPGDKAVENPGRFTVHHVTPRPAWTIPLFTSVKTDASVSPFLPLDFSSCNLALRPQPLVNTQGHITVDAARKSNERFRSALGTDQSDFSPETAIDGELLDQPPFVAISNYYMDFVRSGLIKPCKGRLSKLEGATATVSSNSGDEIITDVAAVVLATGFDPSKSISFLPPSVLETISHSPAHANLPVALAFHGTHHPSLPTLGFVGFYRGPFWGVMEMQARFVARLFQEHATGDIPADSAFRAAIASDESIQRTLALRDDPRCSQFPMGDYAFLMQEFAAALELPISPSLGSLPLMPDGRPLDILTPARYVSPAASDAQKEQALRNLQSTHDSALAGLTGRKFIAAAVFRSLLGEWSLERDLTSKLPSHPSGRFVGTAKFLLRAGTTDGREDKFRDAADESTDQGVEYLYIEDGEFTAAGTNMRFRATRRYIWRYDDTTDTISVWFARTDDPSRADYLFHEVEFGPDHVQGRGGCRAGASHLCIEDLYNVRYEFFFTGVCLLDWRLGYSVLGPRKDYTIDGVYRRTS